MSEAKEYSKETLRLQILDSANKPISEAEVTLTGIMKGIKQYTIILDKKTNSKGEIIKNITDIFPSPVSSFEIDINHKDYYPKPRDNHRRICRSYEYGHPCAAKFNAKTPKFAIKQVDIINNIKNIDDISIAKNFYKSGSIIELKAIYDKKDIKPSQIKWAYKIILQEFKETSQAYTNPTQDTQNKKSESELICAIQKHQANQTIFDKINIANIYPINKDKTFSNKMIYFSDNNDESHNDATQNPQIQTSNIYTGETLAITIPDKIHNKSTKFATLIIFAYVHKPHYKVAQIIRLNDYPQITIDCTLAETLRANARNDKISTLGWGVSYICQRLWHDNPSEAKTIDDLLYKGSRNINFLNSIPNKTVRKLVAETLPRVELKEFALNGNATQRIKSHIQDDKDKNLRFYIELDWEEFYMKFPLMRELEEKILQVIPFEDNAYQFVKGFIKELVYESTESVRRNTNMPKILHNNFFDSAFYNLIMEWLSSQSIQKDLENILNSKNSNAKLVVKLHNIYQGFTKNEKIFSLKNSDWISKNPCENQALIDIIQPYQLWGQYMRAYGLGDTAFVSFFNFKESIALYALTGKFNIYYIPSLFKIIQGKKSKVDIQILEIKAYIFDGFDFIGTPEQFVGVWDYEKMEFKIAKSSRKVLREQSGTTSIVAIENIKQSNEYKMFNQNYQNTQKYFNLGCNFRILTSAFKDIEVHPLSMPISIR